MPQDSNDKQNATEERPVGVSPQARGRGSLSQPQQKSESVNGQANGKSILTGYQEERSLLRESCSTCTGQAPSTNSATDSTTLLPHPPPPANILSLSLLRQGRLSTVTYKSETQGPKKVKTFLTRQGLESDPVFGVNGRVEEPRRSRRLTCLCSPSKRHHGAERLDGCARGHGEATCLCLAPRTLLPQGRPLHEFGSSREQDRDNNAGNTQPSSTARGKRDSLHDKHWAVPTDRFTPARTTAPSVCCKHDSLPLQRAAVPFLRKTYPQGKVITSLQTTNPEHTLKILPSRQTVKQRHRTIRSYRWPCSALFLHLKQVAADSCKAPAI